MSAPIFAEIEIDYEKCKVPFDCKKCLQSCTQAVFGVTPVSVQKGRESNPKEPGGYMLHVAFRDKCTGCNDCIEVCPEDAIKITFPE